MLDRPTASSRTGRSDSFSARPNHEITSLPVVPDRFGNFRGKRNDPFESWSVSTRQRTQQIGCMYSMSRVNVLDRVGFLPDSAASSLLE